MPFIWEEGNEMENKKGQQLCPRQEKAHIHVQKKKNTRENTLSYIKQLDGKSQM